MVGVRGAQAAREGGGGSFVEGPRGERAQAGARVRPGRALALALIGLSLACARLPRPAGGRGPALGERGSRSRGSTGRRSEVGDGAGLLGQARRDRALDRTEPQASALLEGRESTATGRGPASTSRGNLAPRRARDASGGTPPSTVSARSSRTPGPTGISRLRARTGAATRAPEKRARPRPQPPPRRSRGSSGAGTGGRPRRTRGT